MINLSSTIFISDFEYFNIKDKKEEEDIDLNNKINTFLNLSNEFLSDNTATIDNIDIAKMVINENKLECKDKINSFLDDNLRQIDKTKQEHINDLYSRSQLKKMINYNLIEKIEIKINYLRELDKVIKEKFQEGIYIQLKQYK